MEQINTNELTVEQHRLTKAGLNYEPSIQVTRSFLPLRKNKRAWGGVEYPGLFDLDPANDTGWFWFTFTMEVVSLGIAAFLLEERVSASVLLISALSVFFLDFACAYFHHKYKAVECEITNQMRLFLQEMRTGPAAAGFYADYHAHLEQKLKDDKNRKYSRIIFGVFIWVLSLLKGGIFFVAVFSSYWFQIAVSDSKAPYLLIFVILASYLWIAFNHLHYTGYYLAAYSHKSKFNSELSKYKREMYSNNNENHRNKYEERLDFNQFIDKIIAEKHNDHLKFFSRKTKQDFDKDLIEGIVEETVKAGTHYIKKDGNDYILGRNGLITDTQIDELVKVQKNKIAQLAVAMYFHKLQMESLNLH